MVQTVSFPTSIYEEAIGSGSKLAGTGAGGQVVRRHAGQGLRRFFADVGAAFPQENGQKPQEMAFGAAAEAGECIDPKWFQRQGGGWKLGLQALHSFVAGLQKALGGAVPWIERL